MAGELQKCAEHFGAPARIVHVRWPPAWGQVEFDGREQLTARPAEELAHRFPWLDAIGHDPVRQRTQRAPTLTRTGSSSVMYCVLPMAPHIRVPVALFQLFTKSSPQ